MQKGRDEKEGKRESVCVCGRVVINMHKALARFGLVHIAATNLCVWLLCTIHETDEDWRYNEATQKYNVVESASTPKPAGIGAKNSGDSPKEDVVCYVTTTLARNTAPFLFPCTAQYSLIALAMIYKIYCSVGKLHRPRHQTETDPRSLSNPTECHKANKGLFLGLFIAILTLISMSCFFVFDKKLNNAKSAAFIFYITETTLLSLCAGVVVVAFFKLQQLRFLGLEEASFESLLLVISLSGLCMYNIFLVVSSIATVSQFGVLSGLSLISSLLAFVEAALQSVFILDGMRRCAANDGQVMMKPGRALVTFLLLVNLCLWVLNAFEARKADSMPAHTQYYGFLAWSIISHICIPMIIFFRFHSAVCLSDIWTNAYVIKRKEL
ncbi:DgyrCDS8062 [Dimorphilus gyrociliatus]|uniref:DgyrCDS8062 n=1 Tax=Dimorphilus gyrociliatus TaxID=2664684 RepID=A0A7I8VVH7_9ANNE|nr:DgyrCDS8062 [Dimorphilus gyrociliatus]